MGLVANVVTVFKEINLVTNLPDPAFVREGMREG